MAACAVYADRAGDGERQVNLAGGFDRRRYTGRRGGQGFRNGHVVDRQIVDLQRPEAGFANGQPADGQGADRDRTDCQRTDGGRSPCVRANRQAAGLDKGGSPHRRRVREGVLWLLKKIA